MHGSDTTDFVEVFTTDIEDLDQDLTLPVHKDYLAWLNKNVEHPTVLNEMLLLFTSFLKRGYASVNTGRINECHGGTVAKLMRIAMKECPFIELKEEAIIGRSSRKYVFRLRSIRLTDNSSSPSYGYRWSIRRGFGRKVTLSCSWLRSRYFRWKAWCDSKGFPMSVDFIGLTRVAQAAFDGLDRLSFLSACPWSADSLLGDDLRPDGMPGLVYRRWFYDKLTSGRFPRMIRHLDGRSYHAFTNCPRDLRQHARIDGERLAEVDVGSSHLYLLVTILDRDPGTKDECERAIRLIHSGKFYERVAEAAGVYFDDRSELKMETQKQCLFGLDPRLVSRPLFGGLKKLFPKLCRLIERCRRMHGVSEFAKMLFRREGELMNRVVTKLFDMGVPAIRLHDAMLVGESNKELVADVIRQTGIEVFGFEPRVSSK